MTPAAALQPPEAIDGIAEIEPIPGVDHIASLDGLDELRGRLGILRPLVVIDRRALDAAGVGDRLLATLALTPDAVFDAFTPNPRAEQAESAALAAAAFGADGVIAVGGGSCLDVAKVAALAASTPRHARALSRGEVHPEATPLPIVAAPTTSGTGSEATHFAAIYVDGRKVSVAHPAMRPCGVVLDVRLHQAMPPRVAATTGLDALGQALESHWAVASTDATRRDAGRAAALVARHLVASVRHCEPEARRGMMIAAHLAGRAINVGKTTAAHAMSYPMTEAFGLAHGHAVALTLGHLAAWNAGVCEDTCVDPRGPTHVRVWCERAAAVFNATPDEMPAVLSALLRDLGLAADLESAGVPRSAIGALAAQVDQVRGSNNPRRVDVASTAALLASAWRVDR